MSQPKILLTGATGYIGGSVLSQLVKSKHPALQNIACMVRGEDRISKLRDLYGDRVTGVLYKDLDDIDTTIEVASQYDVVINTTNGYHAESSAALVRGLAKRKQATDKDVFMIHTSGTSNLADMPITGTFLETKIFDDSKDDVYGYEKAREAETSYGQRTSELGVVDAGLETGVKTLVIMSPTIYGIGSGEWNKSSIQVPIYVNATLAHGQSVVVGEGKGEWDHVHVFDLAVLYELVLVEVVDRGGSSLPFGKKGIIFSGNGRHSWKEVAQGAADAAFEVGKIKTKEVKSLGLEEGAKVLIGDSKLASGAGEAQQLVEMGFSSNSRTESTVAREKLGWRPTRGQEAWKQGFAEEVHQAIEKTSS